MNKKRRLSEKKPMLAGPRAEADNNAVPAEGAKRSAPRWRHVSNGLGFALAAVVFIQGAGSFRARHEAWVGLQLADQGRSAEAIELARSALDSDPYADEALYLLAAQLKRTGSKDELDALLPRALATHPNQASVRRLAGERAYERQEFENASDLLWEALWINPAPPTSPANTWIMTAVTSSRAGRHGLARAAAVRAVAMAERDASLSTQEKIELLRDAGAVHAAAGSSVMASQYETMARVANQQH